MKKISATVNARGLPQEGLVLITAEDENFTRKWYLTLAALPDLPRSQAIHRNKAKPHKSRPMMVRVEAILSDWPTFICTCVIRRNV